MFASVDSLAHLLHPRRRHSGTVGAIHCRHHRERMPPQAARLQSIFASVVVHAVRQVPVRVHIEVRGVSQEMIGGDVVGRLVQSEVEVWPLEKGFGSFPLSFSGMWK